MHLKSILQYSFFVLIFLLSQLITTVKQSNAKILNLSSLLCHKTWVYNLLNGVCVKKTQNGCPKNTIFNETLNLCVSKMTIKCHKNAGIPDENHNYCTSAVPRDCCPTGFYYNASIFMCIDSVPRKMCPPKTKFNSTLQLCASDPRPAACPNLNLNKKQCYAAAAGIFKDCSDGETNYRYRKFCLPGSMWKNDIKKCVAPVGYPSCPVKSKFDIIYRQCTQKHVIDSKCCPGPNSDYDSKKKFCTSKPLSVMCPKNMRKRSDLNLCVTQKRSFSCPKNSVIDKANKFCVRLPSKCYF